MAGYTYMMCHFAFLVGTHSWEVLVFKFSLGWFDGVFYKFLNLLVPWSCCYLFTSHFHSRHILMFRVSSDSISSSVQSRWEMVVFSNSGFETRAPQYFYVYFDIVHLLLLCICAGESRPKTLDNDFIWIVGTLLVPNFYIVLHLLQLWCVHSFLRCGLSLFSSFDRVFTQLVYTRLAMLWNNKQC